MKITPNQAFNAAVGNKSNVAKLLGIS